MYIPTILDSCQLFTWLSARAPVFRSDTLPPMAWTSASPSGARPHQTALYLSVILGKSDVTRELLREMMKTKSVFSVDNASRSVNRIANLF